MADGRDDVEEIQVWLNNKYGSYPEWETLDEDGIAGWGTIRGIVRGVQIEVGLGGDSVDGDFGDQVARLVPNLSEASWTEDLTALAQCALRVKGYDAPRIIEPFEFAQFKQKTTAAVDQLRSDANYTTLADSEDSGAGIIDRKVWSGLCSQDAYVLVQGGDEELRTIQRRLNSSAYQPAMGLSPTDGIVTPQLARGLIKALQILVGLNNTDDPTDENAADGIWGDKTAERVRDQGSITGGAGEQWTRLLAYAVYVNGATDTNVDDPSWPDIAARANGFGRNMRLDVNVDSGIIIALVVAALFVSHGDQDRGYDDLNAAQDASQPIIGIDTATRLTGLTQTFDTADTGLNDMHAGFVGRYMQNAPDPVLDKEMTLEEIEELSQLRTKNAWGEVAFGIAPIWQTSANDASYFIPGRGTTDAQDANARAEALGIPDNVTIYYAVDFDAFGATIEDLIVPYFQELNAETTRLGGRPIGAYGPRAVGNRMNDEGLATASYVGNLSYGWTGNLGQPMPDNWAIDQFFETDIDFIDDDGNVAGTYGVDELILNPANGQLWYPKAD